MNLDLPNLLKVIGPAASIVFAAWIFMGFLQQRYDAAVDRYRSIVGEYRSGSLPESRYGKARDEILGYKRRCELMSAACTCGLVSAMLLILTLVTAEIALTFPQASALQYVSAASALIGFILVIAAAAIVVVENAIGRRQMNDEIGDVPDLRRPADR